MTSITTNPRPGHQDYRVNVDVKSDLVFRWSTEADRAGCALVSALAFGVLEGHETPPGVRIAEQMASSNFYKGRPNDWALCVDPTRSKPFIRDPAAEPEDPYITRIRQEASEAAESVVAVICWDTLVWSFDGGASDCKVGLVYIVAVRPGYRLGPAIMTGLFSMVHDRGRMQGVAFHTVTGIPSYYRTHGYEYGVHMGRQSITTVSDLPVSIRSPPPETPLNTLTANTFQFRDATLDDVPRLVDIWEANKPFADIWTSVKSPELLRDYVNFCVGGTAAATHASQGQDQRSVNASNGEILSVDRADPFWIMEMLDPSSSGSEPTLAAAVYLRALPSRTELQKALKERQPLTITIRRLIWNSDLDAAQILETLMAKLIARVNDKYRELIAEGLEDDMGVTPQLEGINWGIPIGHPLFRTLQTMGFVRPMGNPSGFDLPADVNINIFSLPDFLLSMQGALNARLARASHLLGRSFSQTIRIITPRASYVGAAITIRNCRVESIEPFTVKPEHRRSRSFGNEDTQGPNVILPQSPLTQLLMGYKSWEEVKSVYPDVMIHPKVLMIFEVLFPKRIMGGYLY